MATKFNIKAAALPDGWTPQTLASLTFETMEWSFESPIPRSIAIAIPKYGFIVWQMQDALVSGSVFSMNFVPLKELSKAKRDLKTLHRAYHALEDKYRALLEMVTE